MVLLRLVAQRTWLKRGAVQESQLSAGNITCPLLLVTVNRLDFAVGCKDSGATVNGTLCSRGLDVWQKVIMQKPYGSTIAIFMAESAIIWWHRSVKCLCPPHGYKYLILDTPG